MNNFYYNALTNMYNNTDYEYTVKENENILLVGSDDFIHTWLLHLFNYDSKFIQSINFLKPYNSELKNDNPIIVIDGNIGDYIGNLSETQINEYLEKVEYYLSSYKGIKIIGINHLPNESSHPLFSKIGYIISNHIYKENVFIEDTYNLNENDIAFFGLLQLKFYINNPYEIYKHIKITPENKNYILATKLYENVDFSSYNFLQPGKVDEVTFGPFKICHVKVISPTNEETIFSYVLKNNIILDNIWKIQCPFTNYKEEVEIMKYLLYYDFIYNIVDEENNIYIHIPKYTHKSIVDRSNYEEQFIDKTINDLTDKEIDLIDNYLSYLYYQIDKKMFKFHIEYPLDYIKNYIINRKTINNNYNIDEVQKCIDILNNSKEFDYGKPVKNVNGIYEIRGYRYPKGLRESLTNIFDSNYGINWNLNYDSKPETWNLSTIHSYILGCIRGERFGDGILLSQIESGKLLKVLNILKNR